MHELYFTLFLYELYEWNIDLKWDNIRSSHRRCSLKKGALKNFTKFTGKHMSQSLFFNNVAEQIN